MTQTTYTAANISRIIKNYIIQEFMYDRVATDLTIDTLLIEEGIIDSMGIFRLITFLEEQFGFTIKPEEVVLESFETITAITGLVKTHLT
ncbi:acyl carrier protein [Desulfonema magnum]|uniref:Phosphopantetheine binding ACP domain-containing protein n=1 Tax=Desulfonema magnum TaxID=45655 RepID=A0A975BM89_9BACT|nr:acyl carrier protein [Desulfonema magnum]QTA87827.1 Phosphopantetheine binding ACP domain-containing protein [Desulfonema magnum]